MKRIGKRGLKRQAFNRRLKRLMIELGIFSCEIRLPGCLGAWALSFAHSKKSRFLITDEDWMTAVLSCPVCHQALDERMGHAEMERLVLEAIERRPNAGRDRVAELVA